MKRLTPWIWATASCAALVLFLCTLNIAGLLMVLFCVAGFLIDFFCTPLVRKRNAEYWARRKEAAVEKEKQHLAESEATVRARLASGELRYLVEWWEEDILEIDENHHLLFIFTDGTERDFILYEPIEQKLVFLLAENGITWHPRFNLHFDSAILHPPALRGQQFYTPDGKVREELERST